MRVPILMEHFEPHIFLLGTKNGSQPQASQSYHPLYHVFPFLFFTTVFLLLRSVFILVMDWYYGSDVNDFLVPKDQDLLDRHPSPGCWSNWGVNANEGFNLPKKFVVMDFMDESFDNQFRLESSIHNRFNESLNNQIELESSLQDKDGSSSSSVCGGLPEKSFQQTALSCDQPNHQLQDLPRFKQTDDIFLYKLNFHSFDTWFCSLNCFGLALVYSACQLQKHTAASNSDDLLDIKVIILLVD
ncbi:hypothetical protein Ahy_A10g047028 isoform F [Arachis hypogaea]|uniref:Uncharacterized protein n=1 Tax=Arachis hypogaea TaxID=3818 RepID=A0A445B1B0_ARAHY|nr:hypothetical protein Ahy_A10g047028 isoform F [Arachis hypogaea]